MSAPKIASFTDADNETFTLKSEDGMIHLESNRTTGGLEFYTKDAGQLADLIREVAA